MRARAKQLIRCPALFATGMMGAGGVGFALANILLARALSAREFGEISLFLTLTQLSFAIAPLGLEVTINRHRLSASRHLLIRTLLTGLVLGPVLAFIAWRLYDMDAAMAAVLAPTAVAIGANRVGCAFLQTRQLFSRALFLTQVHNYVLLVAVPLAAVVSGAGVTAMVACGYLLTAFVAWSQSWPAPDAGGSAPSGAQFWREGLAAFGIGLAAHLLWQMERLVIPRALSMEDLATFSVLAAVAASPYRMLQMGVGYTLLPRLGHCRDRASIYRLLHREGLATGAIALVATVIVVLLTPWVLEHALHSRYRIGVALLASAIAVGLVKVWHGLAASVVNALGAPAQLTRLNLTGWFCAGLGFSASIWAGRYGLIGVIWGVGVAWIVFAAVATHSAVKAIRLRPAGVT